MDRCAAMNFLTKESDFKNAFRILFHPNKIDGYMEEHKIYEILSELIIRTAIERPENLIDFMISKLLKISEKFRRNVVEVGFNEKDSGEAEKVLLKLRFFDADRVRRQLKADFKFNMDKRARHSLKISSKCLKKVSKEPQK